MFNPRTLYEIKQRAIPIEDFHRYSDEFMVRPPYQRKNVWTDSKQQGLLDSLFRRYYIPRIVLREIRLADDRTLLEVIDGLQRIVTAQRFFRNKLRLPESLREFNTDLSGKTYSQLAPEIRRFADRDCTYDADIVKGIDNPLDAEHQGIAAEIFWRFQQGTTLNYMEVAHSRLSSLARNFVVKYSDDEQSDYQTYESVDGNHDKHVFFTLINRDNDRMEHLALLTRFMILEEGHGYGDVKETNIREYIDRYQVHDGIGNYSLENEAVAKNVLANMNAMYEVFRDDPMVRSGGVMRELTTEYFVISVYLLIRHLRMYYVIDDTERNLLRSLTTGIYSRWRNSRSGDDADILLFSDNRQQDQYVISARDRILRQVFFQFVREEGHQMLRKDTRRAFSEEQRIAIYRACKGLCQECIIEGKPEREAVVPWSEYEADHIVAHAQGGATEVENAQVLCRYHHHRKTAAMVTGTHS